MAKKKNPLKAGLKSLRQALSTVKTAIIHFSDDHIVAIGYNPTSKETIVTDIPQNLSSQFILGEGGGGGDLSPKATVTLKPSGCGAYYLDNAINTGNAARYQIADGHISYVSSIDDRWGLIADNGTGTFSAYAVKQGDDFIVVPTFYQADRSYHIEELAFSDLVNCVNDDGDIIVSDPTKEVSFTVDVLFQPVI